jgi:hypothetical protein
MAYGQDLQFGKMAHPKHANTNGTLEPFRIKLVRNPFRAGRPLRTGFIQLHRTSDEGAVDLLKVIGVKGSLSVDEQLTALRILHGV